jgi:peptide deformylase
MPSCPGAHQSKDQAPRRAGTGPEGCLSFPEIYGDITRPGEVEVEALDGSGEPILFRCGGLLARAVQHEYDHLHGILFIDRMEKKTKEQIRPELERYWRRPRLR